MPWSFARSLRVALAGLSLAASPWRAAPPARGQDTPPPTAGTPTAKPAPRLEELDRLIDQRLDAGQVAEAIPPAREVLELLERTRGKDDWRTGDARRNLQTYERLAGQPREVRERYAEALRAEAQGLQHLARGRYAEAAPLFQESLSIRQEILGEGHPDSATGYDNLARTLHARGRYAEAEATHRRALAIRLKALGDDHPDAANSYNNLAGTLRS